jgi:hypothetical protein
MRWISGFLRAFRRVCRGGDEVDFWGFAGVPAGVPPVVLRGSLYVIYSTCLPPYNVVRPGASSHCERRPRHYACAACVSEWCAWFPWISSVVCVVCVVRFPTIARACHAACDAHLVPTLRALHHRVPRSYKRAHVPGRVGGVCCVPRNTRFPRADFFLLMIPTPTTTHHVVDVVPLTAEATAQVKGCFEIPRSAGCQDQRPWWGHTELRSPRGATKAW